MNIKAKVAELGLPKNTYVVVGSGILAALELRHADDVDLIVTDEVFEKLKSDGWKTSQWQDQIVLKKDVYDIGTTWMGQAVTDLLPQAQIIDDIPYLSLSELRKWKVSMGRPKDLADIELIDSHSAD